jgi:hypothetical protein
MVAGKRMDDQEETGLAEETFMPIATLCRNIRLLGQGSVAIGFACVFPHLTAADGQALAHSC